VNPALMQLAAAAGIEDGYWDGLGVRRDLQEPTAVALLSALGFDPSADPLAQCAALTDAPFLSPLPPAVVVPCETRCQIVIALPIARREEAIAWELELESGGRLQGEFLVAHAPLVEERDCGGRLFGRYRMTLDAELALGYHRLRLPALAAQTLLIAAPARCFVPQALAQGERCWGLAVQLYAVRSARNWGIGDLGDLMSIAAAAGQAGAAFVGLNPLHARRQAYPDEASPYAPSSRCFLDPIYIDVEAAIASSQCRAACTAVAGADFQARLARARATSLVDYAAVGALKFAILEKLYEDFGLQGGAAAEGRRREFRAFVQRGGAPLAHYAAFEAQSLHACVTPAHIEFQMYLQWLASTQLDDAAAAARAAGMSIGLYCDLAVGAAPDGAECASEPRLFAGDISIGAPPDLLSRQGQRWGLPPWNPRALAQAEFAPFRALLAANMRTAGALRIDHVMALTRLFWIPQSMSGADGGYVRNPYATLAAIVALESVRNRCMVIGEDLGAVPDGLRASLHDHGFLSYRVLVYERHWHGDGRFCLPHEYPRQALATVATHDMPTMTEYWQGGDIGRREQLGLYPAPQQRDEEEMRRRHERDGMLWLLGESGLSPADPAEAGQVIESLHGAVARSAAMLAAIQLDDIIGETAPVNIPGTHREYANWRRKQALPIEAILSDARWLRLAAIMREAGRSGRSSPG
jgi:4-alpha-glucanotransferase